MVEVEFLHIRAGVVRPMGRSVYLMPYKHFRGDCFSAVWMGCRPGWDSKRDPYYFFHRFVC